MKKKRIITICVVALVILAASAVYLNRAAIFQRGNPIPYLISAVQISEKNPYVAVDETKGVYISKRGECPELFDYFCERTGMEFVEQAGSGYLFTDGDRNDVISSEVYWGRYTVWTLPDIETVSPNKCLDEISGNITFYEEPVKEAQNGKSTLTVSLSRDLNKEQADKLKDILDDVDEWVDDHSVDRLAYYFDGDFELSDREHSYYFTYEYNVIYYDHYYAEISAEDMQYIKDLGAECVELPDIESNSISFNDLAPGTETTFGTKIDVRTDNSELAYTLTYGRASISLEIGLRSEDGTELATEITGGDAKGVISNVPAGTYTVFLRNIEEVNQEVTETPNVTGALHFYIVELPGIERTDEPDEYPDTNIVPGFNLDEPNEPTT